MTCAECKGTGSLSKSDAGYLDCIHCDVAAERMALEAWVRRNAPSAAILEAWAIYKRGKAAGVIEVARSGA